MAVFCIIWYIIILPTIRITEITINHNMKIYEHKQILVKASHVSIDS